MRTARSAAGAAHSRRFRPAAARPILTVDRADIARLMSPSDLGALLKPFVFLDRVELRAS